jgi:hypothetical protein
LFAAGNGYSLDAIKEERERIDARLKENGFYYFNPDYIKVQVDSTVGDHHGSDCKIKDETPALAQQQYKINKVIVYPNYAINLDKQST